jgi:hypothetical protein
VNAVRAHEKSSVGLEGGNGRSDALTYGKASRSIKIEIGRDHAESGLRTNGDFSRADIR